MLVSRSPRKATDWVRSVGALTLDQRFEAGSPFPKLPSNLSARIVSSQVILPQMDAAGPGNQDIPGLLFLVRTAIALQARVVFEVGTYNGLTALTFGLNLPQATIHTLDLAPMQEPTLRLFPTDELHLPTAAPRLYEGRPEAPRIIQHIDDSAHFDFSALHGSVDLTYIDGSHSFEYVKNDSNHAFRMASNCSAIVWDDYRRTTPDVARYLHTLPATGMYRVQGSRLVVWFSPTALSRLLEEGHAKA
jgi:hypothetical protein